MIFPNQFEKQTAGEIAISCGEALRNWLQYLRGFEKE
jgi:hypothetical protein